MVDEGYEGSIYGRRIAEEKYRMGEKLTAKVYYLYLWKYNKPIFAIFKNYKLSWNQSFTGEG